MIYLFKRLFLQKEACLKNYCLHLLICLVLFSPYYSYSSSCSAFSIWKQRKKRQKQSKRRTIKKEKKKRREKGKNNTKKEFKNIFCLLLLFPLKPSRPNGAQKHWKTYFLLFPPFFVGGWRLSCKFTAVKRSKKQRKIFVENDLLPKKVFWHSMKTKQGKNKNNENKRRERKRKIVKRRQAKNTCWKYV